MTEAEVEKFKLEVEVQKKATSTKEACAEIVKYVQANVEADLLVNPSKENPYHQAPSSGGGCCIIS
eukprot:CAMPEP_0202092402 /NCGR_PEP_ID=MMETSP0964-20121228/48017_1 /ASSEMBLY_ACC=CAM_ASM_000500 /TAXON_ID=4773 /ORGANISM="Schizochytrium aggregatum, Strain ATCC28209" /LENGTH=65 /DNA_ID=CAMNT_0048660641 /DNA_START=164 /DNA_END=361 /DNA_ORIENTATION=-